MYQEPEHVSDTNGNPEILLLRVLQVSIKVSAGLYSFLETGMGESALKFVEAVGKVKLRTHIFLTRSHLQTLRFYRSATWLSPQAGSLFLQGQ